MPTEAVSVLIVDDHVDIRELTAMLIDLEPGLEVWGTAASGADALGQLGQAVPRGAGPDVLLSDVSMPEMSGIELVAKVAERYPLLPCVVFSSHPSWLYAESARVAGARGYVEKGKPDEISDALRRATTTSGWTE